MIVVVDDICSKRAIEMEEYKKQMRVAIDTLFANIGGGVTYIYNLLPNLAEVDKENEYLIICSLHQQKFIFELPNNFQYLKVRVKPGSAELRMLWQQIELPIILKKHKIDILYSPNDTSPVLAPCKVVLAIRNPNPYTKLETAISLKDKYRIGLLKQLTRLSARKAHKVIFVSNHSKNIISQQLNIPTSKCVTVYHGLDSRFSINSFDVTPILQKYRIGAHPYILSVSTIYRYKNFVPLINAYALLRKKCSVDCVLVIAGKVMDEGYFHEMKSAINQNNLQDNVYLLGEVEYSEIHLLYKGALLFVFPSYLETFGHPLVEAMASGVPVVSSNASVMPEICGDAALYFNPFDTNELANVLLYALTNKSLREKMRLKGLKRAKEFSWRYTTRNTLEVFKSAYEE